jgi:hypothetical protein
MKSFEESERDKLEALMQLPPDKLTPEQRIQIWEAQNPPTRKRRPLVRSEVLVTPIEQAEIDQIRAKPAAERTAMENLKLANHEFFEKHRKNGATVPTTTPEEIVPPALQLAREIDDLEVQERKVTAMGSYMFAANLRRQIEKKKEQLAALRPK